MTRVTLFTKDGCHLCDEARKSILAVATDTPFEYAEVHIAPGDGHYEKYHLSIPVVEINGNPAFYARVNEKRFREMVRGAEEPG